VQNHLAKCAQAKSLKPSASERQYFSSGRTVSFGNIFRVEQDKGQTALFLQDYRPGGGGPRNSRMIPSIISLSGDQEKVGAGGDGGSILPRNIGNAQAAEGKTGRERPEGGVYQRPLLWVPKGGKTALWAE